VAATTAISSVPPTRNDFAHRSLVRAENPQHFSVWLGCLCERSEPANVEEDHRDVRAMAFKQFRPFRASDELCSVSPDPAYSSSSQTRNDRGARSRCPAWSRRRSRSHPARQNQERLFAGGAVGRFGSRVHKSRGAAARREPTSSAEASGASVIALASHAAPRRGVGSISTISPTPARAFCSPSASHRAPSWRSSITRRSGSR